MDEKEEVLIYNVSLLIIIMILSIAITPWALLGLIFTAATHDLVRVEHNGTVVEMEVSDAEEVPSPKMIQNTIQSVETRGPDEQ